MKIIIQSAAAVTAVCLLAGCETTGLSPREIPNVTYQDYIMSLQSNETNTPLKVSTPIRLAVAQIGEVAPPQTMLDKLASRKTLVLSVDGLPLPADTASLPFYTGEGYDRGTVQKADLQEPDYNGRIKKICGLARAAGADYVFLFGGNLDSWKQKNFLYTLDAIVVGGVILPGTRIHMEGKGAGTLISTTTCQPVLFASADVRRSAFSPDFFVDGKTMGLQSQVRDQLAAKLTEQLVEKLQSASVQ